MSNEMTINEARSMDLVGGAYPIEHVKAQVQMVQHLMKEIMHEGTHYGKIPGCGDKPALFKGGAEKLGFTFRLLPTFDVQLIDMGNGHREYRIKCVLNHGPSGQIVGEGVGSCSTMESKYRWRNAGRKCPECGKEGTIIKGKADYGGGWICFAKKGGCGGKWNDGEKSIESQEQGKVENPDIADQYNTCLKMAKKRAHVDAMITSTAASDIFTQDIEDFDFSSFRPVAAKVIVEKPATATEKHIKHFHEQSEEEGYCRYISAVDSALVRVGMPLEDLVAIVERSRAAMDKDLEKADSGPHKDKDKEQAPPPVEEEDPKSPSMFEEE